MASVFWDVKVFLLIDYLGKEGNHHQGVLSIPFGQNEDSDHVETFNGKEKGVIPPRCNGPFKPCRSVMKKPSRRSTTISRAFKKTIPDKES